MRPRNRTDSPSAEGESANPTPAGAAEPQWPDTDPSAPSRASAFASARGIQEPVVASPEEMRRAREIWEQLRKRYLDRDAESGAAECVDTD